MTNGSLAVQQAHRGNPCPVPKRHKCGGGSVRDGMSLKNCTQGEGFMRDVTQVVEASGSISNLIQTHVWHTTCTDVGSEGRWKLRASVVEKGYHFLIEIEYERHIAGVQVCMRVCVCVCVFPLPSSCLSFSAIQDILRYCVRLVSFEARGSVESAFSERTAEAKCKRIWKSRGLRLDALFV